MSDREQRHAPIPLRWMTAPEVEAHRRVEASLIAYASACITQALRIQDPELYRLARSAFEDARARWQEFT